MAASLQLLDASDTEISLDDTNPADFGTVGSGSTGPPVELKVKNDGDEKVFFVKIRAIKHPDSQVGDEDHTFAATEFSTTQNGDYVDELDLVDELAVGATASFWVRWVVPADAPSGDVVWAVEAIGAET